MEALRRRRYLALLASALLLGSARPTERAQPEPAEILVTTTADAGAGSLREAILRAKAHPGPITIRFDSRRGPFATPQTISLRSELPPLEREVTIDGYIEGRLWQPTGVTISGGRAHRVLQIAPGARAGIRSLTIADGKAERGAGILNHGALIVKGVTFRANAAQREGGALASDGSLVVINSTFAENEAGESGGALAHGAGKATITHCTFANNRARSGGGLFSRAPVLVRNSILAHSGGSDCTALAGVDPRSTHNLIMSNDGCGKPILSSDPKLEKLGLYSGPTATIPLSGASPAINLGDNASALDEDGRPLVWDQRGNGDPRFVAGFADLGAFEVQAFPLLKVNTLEDNGLRACSGVGQGDCPLRGALELAHVDDNPKVITFDRQVFASGRRLEVMKRLPDVTVPLTLDGTEAGGITVRAPALRSRGNGRLTLRGVTLDTR